MTESSGTNVSLIQEFEHAMDRYESTIVPNSNHFHEYRQPADHVKQALLILVTAPEAETHSMMKRLAARIAGGIDTIYSDLTINMMAAATRDERARQLIMSLLYTTREKIMGEAVELHEGWLHFVNHNHAIHAFLNFFGIHNPDTVIEETYSGNAVGNIPKTEYLSSFHEHVVIEIDDAKYNIKLENRVFQIVSFRRSENLEEVYEQNPSKSKVITTEVILTPTIGALAFDKSVGFYDDALAQMKALNCSPSGYNPDRNTTLVLPNIFYSLAVIITSSNAGKTWRISEMNILPPSIS